MMTICVIMIIPRILGSLLFTFATLTSSLHFSTLYRFGSHSLSTFTFTFQLYFSILLFFHFTFTSTLTFSFDFDFDFMFAFTFTFTSHLSLSFVSSTFHSSLFHFHFCYLDPQPSFWDFVKFQIKLSDVKDKMLLKINNQGEYLSSSLSSLISSFPPGWEFKFNFKFPTRVGI